MRTIDVNGIQELIPHRYPFLLVDSVDVLEEDKIAIGTKCVTMNEHFFQGHSTLQASQGRTDTEMRTATESEVTTGFSADVELVRLIEVALVAVGRGKHQ